MDQAIPTATTDYSGLSFSEKCENYSIEEGCICFIKTKDQSEKKTMDPSPLVHALITLSLSLP
jgi:hypothetical protein